MVSDQMQQAVVRAAGVAGLAIICGALALGGANDAARAAMLAGALLAATLIVLLARKPAEIGAVALSHAVSLTAAALFVLWALTTAAANPDGSPMSALNHPLWREFGLTNGAISIAPYRTLEGVAGFLAPAAAFALGALVADTRETRNWIGAWLPLACFAFAGFGLWTFFSGPSHARLAAALGSPNAAATALGVMAILLAAAIARAARAPAPPGRKMPPKLRWAQPVMNAPLAIIALIFTAVALALTQSRAGLIATGFAFLALVVLLGPVQSKQRSRAVLLAACVAVGLFAFLIVGANGGAVLERYAGFEKAVAARADVLDVHWRAFLDRPLLGHGLNTFHEINAHYAAPETWGNVRIVGSAHNIFLQAAEETGIVGLLLFAAMLLPPIWFAARRVWLGASGAEWAAGALAATLLCLAHGLTDFGLQVPATAALLAFALGAFAKPPAEPKTFTDALAVTPPKPRRAGDAAAP